MTNRTHPGIHLSAWSATYALVLLSNAPVRAQAPDAAARYASPDEALKALTDAAKAEDMVALTKLFGPQLKDLLSGDQVQDASELENFSKRLERSAKFEPEGDDQMILSIGADGFPFPVPLMKKDGTWYFDTAEGKEEVLNRRIGENELRAISVCRGYVAAQYEYYAQDRDGDNVLEYAQRLGSTPGKQDGLFWETKEGDPPSPLGPLAAQARGEGYATGDKKEGDGPTPYFGYVFKPLAKQGSNAPGGKFDYPIHGNMVAGFALLAYPVDWGNSGVMTFMVGANGNVLEKNLAEKTAELVGKIDAFDPDDTWVPAED